MLTDRRTDRLPDRRTSSIHKPELLCNPAKMFTPMTQKLANDVKERGGGQTFSTSFWMRFSQAPLCRYRFKVISDDIIFLLSGNIIEYIYFDVSIQKL